MQKTKVSISGTETVNLNIGLAENTLICEELENSKYPRLTKMGVQIAIPKIDGTSPK
jgi:hypothetical protein